MSPLTKRPFLPLDLVSGGRLASTASKENTFQKYTNPIGQTTTVCVKCSSASGMELVEAGFIFMTGTYWIALLSLSKKVDWKFFTSGLNKGKDQASSPVGEPPNKPPPTLHCAHQCLLARASSHWRL